MSTVPSLSLWSSIKIPHFAYSTINKNERTSSVPHMDFHETLEKRNHVQETETAGEMINLKVPNSIQAIERKNSCTSIVCERSEIHEKTTTQNTTRKRSKKLRFLKVPEIPLNDENLEETLKITTCEGLIKSISYYGDVLEESEERYDWSFEKNSPGEGEEEGEEESAFDIPSVKPWTLEELEEINKKYNIMENKIKKIFDSKSKNKREVSKPSVSVRCDNKIEFSKPPSKKKSSNFDPSEFYFNCEWTHSQPDFDSDQDLLRFCEQSIDLEKSKSAGEKYYQSKLAQLRLIERGIKR